MAEQLTVSQTQSIHMKTNRMVSNQAKDTANSASQTHSNKPIRKKERIDCYSSICKRLKIHFHTEKEKLNPKN